MTKEKAIDIIKCLAWHTRPNEEDIEQAIEALSAEPSISSVSFWCRQKGYVMMPEAVYEQDMTKAYFEGQNIEPCEDCISRQAAFEQINCWIGSGEYRYTNATDYLTKRISKLPPVTPKQKMGRWIMPVQDDGMSDPIYYQVRCSECDFDLDPQTWHMELHQYGADKYCPNCGAKMSENPTGSESEDTE